MTDQAVQERRGDVTAEVMERVITAGDLAKLSAAQRVAYYRRVCETLGLNPLTRPFQYIVLNGKLTLYATRDCTDQLRALRGISIERLDRELVEGVFLVTAYGRDARGRVDSSTGAVAVEGLRGEARANALMKAETKAKRRLTLSLAGLGWLDEIEVDSVPSSAAVEVNAETGEIERGPAPALRESIAARRAAVASRTPTPAQIEDGDSEDAPVPELPPSALCDVVSPYGDAAACVLEAGHRGNHRSAGKESWS